MAEFCDADTVQQWLEKTKLTISSIDAALDQLAVQSTFGALSARYDVTTWLNETTTPGLVVQLVAMRYASSFYRRQYSEDLEEDNPYAVWLEKTTQSLLDQIVAGVIDLGGAVIVDTSGLSDPIFYPNDLADIDDARKFTMASVF